MEPRIMMPESSASFPNWKDAAHEHRLNRRAAQTLATRSNQHRGGTTPQERHRARFRSDRNDRQGDIVTRIAM